MAGNINSGRKIKDDKKMPKTFRLHENMLESIMNIAARLNVSESEIVERAIQIYTETLQKIFDESRDELL